MQKAFIQRLKSSDIKFIRLLWCDNANIIRGKAIHIDALAHHFDYGVGISAAQQAIPVMYDAVVPETGLGPVGEVRLIPDWSSFATLPYAPGHARVIGDMTWKGQAWPYCSRGFLKRMIADAEEEGIEVIAAFENEFYLLRVMSDGLVPADNTVFASTQSMDINREVIEEIVDALLAQGMPVEQYYPESGPGQHEISLHYSPALVASDRQISFRETVRAVSNRHGLKASFLPKIFSDKAGSGCHLHLSLWHKGENIVPDPQNPYGLSKISQNFIGGLLYHLPALMAITTPIPNSYRRLRPHFWSGAFRCWGIDNREAAVRVVTNPDGYGTSQFEFKTVDASSNPYLALGSVIAAGLDGIRRGLEPGNPVEIDPGYLSEEEQKSRGIDLLPVSLESAMECLRNDDVLLRAIGSELSRAYLAVRKAECEALKNLNLAEEVNLLLEKY